ncbi:MAG TPA: anthranilate phosphoribosyltransferase [Candidatus Omnitrophota bacterium]|nr:anthranilate phosphoribosyltransferase [Candidatus Omnitrophota bacterium]HPS20163.1 anthranilate phosphoribosyltransferase [Candidatus Omnitrophota bacterium]
MTIKDAIKKVTEKGNLSEEESHSLFSEIMDGNATPSQIGALLAALRMKGETVLEITGAARVMREKAIKVRFEDNASLFEKGDVKDDAILDTCGTGGTGRDTFNISTPVSFVVAACGVKVAKHGNRSASGRCGSADVLEKLGVKIDAPIEVTKKCIQQIGVGFMYAPLYHTAMRHAMATRKEIGIKTIFNLLGPLANPASANCQVVGVFDPRLTEVIADVLGKLGARCAYVVHGMDNLDEVTITTKTKVSEYKDGRVWTYYVEPHTFGFKIAKKESIKGGNVDENATIVKSILGGERGPRQEIVLMNASCALMAAGKSKGFKEGVAIAREAIESGKAREKMEQLIRMTNEGVL